jgi:hypothetical protein
VGEVDVSPAKVERLADPQSAEHEDGEQCPTVRIRAGPPVVVRDVVEVPCGIERRRRSVRPGRGKGSGAS